MLDLHRIVKNLSIDKMQCAGTKHTGVPVKTLKKLLKKAGLKVSGKKATLTRRAKRAKLFGGVNFRDKQLANRSTMGDTMNKQKFQTQYQADLTRAEEDQKNAKRNNDFVIANAVKEQNEATQERTDAIKRATPMY
jgi:hypothetical protein